MCMLHINARSAADGLLLGWWQHRGGWTGRFSCWLMLGVLGLFALALGGAAGLLQVLLWPLLTETLLRAGLHEALWRRAERRLRSAGAGTGGAGLGAGGLGRTCAPVARAQLRARAWRVVLQVAGASLLWHSLFWPGPWALAAGLVALPVGVVYQTLRSLWPCVVLQGLLQLLWLASGGTPLAAGVRALAALPGLGG